MLLSPGTKQSPEEWSSLRARAPFSILKRERLFWQRAGAQIARKIYRDEERSKERILLKKLKGKLGETCNDVANEREEKQVPLCPRLHTWPRFLTERQSTVTLMQLLWQNTPRAYFIFTDSVTTILILIGKKAKKVE